MKKIREISTWSVAFLLFCVCVAHANQSAITLNRNLLLGMSGEDVRQLQIILNKDKDTMVANTGIGSPGQESNYFGVLTQKAVIRFQEKFADKILKPSNLTRGTGIAGKNTREFLSSGHFLTANNINPILSTTPLSTNTVSPVATSTLATFKASTTPTNSIKQGPNYENASLFMDSVEKVSKKKGYSSEKIALIKDQIYQGLSTTTDLKKEFIKMIKKQEKNVSKNDRAQSLFGEQFSSLLTKIRSTIYPKEVSAETGIPFGGALLFAFPCNCSNTWLLEISPLPPTGVVLLDYIQGSQAYLSYNIPITNWLLGEYIIGAQTCFTGYMCTGIPAEGLITPMVGSSLI